MKVFLFVIFLLISTINTKGQAESQNDLFASIKKLELSKSDIHPTSASRFKSLIIIDHRPDTNRLGVYRNSFGRPVQVVFEQGTNLQNVFACLSADTGTSKLHLFINSLELVHETYDSTIKRNLSFSYILFNAKVYVDRDSVYLPLIKIDTIIRIDGNLENASDDLISNVVTVVSEKSSKAIEDGKFEKRIHLTKYLLDSINGNKYLSFGKVSTNDSGFFLTYDDFINGRITKADFLLQKIDDKTSFVYEKQKDGTEILLSKIWGLYKGGKYYIMDFGFLHPLYRINNAYYWYGIHDVRDRGIPIPFYAPLGGGSYMTGLGELKIGTKFNYMLNVLNLNSGVAY